MPTAVQQEEARLWAILVGPATPHPAKRCVAGELARPSSSRRRMCCARGAAGLQIRMCAGFFSALTYFDRWDRHCPRNTHRTPVARPPPIRPQRPRNHVLRLFPQRSFRQARPHTLVCTHPNTIPKPPSDIHLASPTPPSAVHFPPCSTPLAFRRAPLPTSRARAPPPWPKTLPRRLFRDLCPLVQRAPRSKCRGWRGAAIRANAHCMQVQSKRVVGLADQAVLALSQSARAEQPIAVPPARTPAVPAVPGVVRR